MDLLKTGKKKKKAILVPDTRSDRAGIPGGIIFSEKGGGIALLS